MKLRIKGNSLRLRLTKSEVQKLSDETSVEEQTSFGDSILVYKLQASPIDTIKATFNNNQITVLMPKSIAKEWPDNNIISHQSQNAEPLFILIEKDFKCIDATNEDQSDNYENPSKTC